jgi:hypothetical protein
MWKAVTQTHCEHLPTHHGEEKEEETEPDVIMRHNILPITGE